MMKAEVELELDKLSRGSVLLDEIKELNCQVLEWTEVKAVRGLASTTANPLVDPIKLDFAVRALADLDSDIRREAAFLLGLLGGGSQHIRALKQVITDPTNGPDVIVAVCEALATIGGPEAVKLLKQYVRPGNAPDVIEAALLGLHGIASLSQPGVFGPAGSEIEQITNVIDSAQRENYGREIQLLAQGLRYRLA